MNTCLFFSIERLKLKIPWKSLYSSPIVAEIDGLYAIVGPATGEVHPNPTEPHKELICLFLIQHSSTMLKRVPKRLENERRNN